MVFCNAPDPAPQPCRWESVVDCAHEGACDGMGQPRLLYIDRDDNRVSVEVDDHERAESVWGHVGKMGAMDPDQKGKRCLDDFEHFIWQQWDIWVMPLEWKQQREQGLGDKGEQFGVFSNDQDWELDEERGHDGCDIFRSQTREQGLEAYFIDDWKRSRHRGGRE
mmetsp:Transcript_2256/g.4304  ORF Transcript_2256/g.4304 Transcript_2256/m.4304 type:complete len:165 (-) Transcript_2256:1431-1925(-)